MGGVYVTYVADAGKGQRHLETLGCSFKQIKGSVAALFS